MENFLIILTIVKQQAAILLGQKTLDDKTDDVEAQKLRLNDKNVLNNKSKIDHGINVINNVFWLKKKEGHLFTTMIILILLTEFFHSHTLPS